MNERKDAPLPPEVRNLITFLNEAGYPNMADNIATAAQLAHDKRERQTRGVPLSDNADGGLTAVGS